MDSQLENIVEETDKNIFDNINDGSDGEDYHTADDKDQNEGKVARPTTKPTDRGRKYEKQSYTFWTEKDKDKLNTFQQFSDPSVIAPKKLDGNVIPQENVMTKTGSAWNKSGTTW